MHAVSDHQSRTAFAREHAEGLRRSMAAASRRRPEQEADTDEGRVKPAHVHRISLPRPHVHRGAAT